MSKHFILGLDISTSCTGVCVLDNERNLVLLDHIRLDNIKTGFYDKANFVKRFLQELKKKYDIKEIYAEESLMRFRRGKSSAKVLSTLNKFNGVVSYIAYEIFDVIPIHILAPHARKIVGITITKKEKKERGIKPIILEYVKAELSDKLVLAYKRTGKIKDYIYDQCDAYVIARAGYTKYDR
tara:strand:+ start:225 stop:770 length:546 start_codon:yes stop_codon:yes gene_type:complete